MRAEVRVQLDDRVNCELCTLTYGMFIIRTTCMHLSLSASCTFHAILFFCFFFTHSSFYSCLQFHYYISPSFDIYFMCPDIIFSSPRPLPLLWLCCVSLGGGSVSMFAWTSSRFLGWAACLRVFRLVSFQCCGPLSPLSGSPSIRHCAMTETEWNQKI